MDRLVDALVIVGAMVIAILLWMFGIPLGIFWRANRKWRQE